MQIERWNSKVRSGYSFDSIYKIYFAAFLHRSFEVIQIWLTHQSKGLIFYLSVKNFFNRVTLILKKKSAFSTSSNYGFPKVFCIEKIPKFFRLRRNKGGAVKRGGAVDSNSPDFGMKKVLSPIFESFVGNRQTKFHILKFRVCVNTH